MTRKKKDSIRASQLLCSPPPVLFWVMVYHAITSFIFTELGINDLSLFKRGLRHQHCFWRENTFFYVRYENCCYSGRRRVGEWTIHQIFLKAQFWCFHWRSKISCEQRGSRSLSKLSIYTIGIMHSLQTSFIFLIFKLLLNSWRWIAFFQSCLVSKLITASRES